MEIMFRSAALVLICAMVCLLLKKNTPELSMLLSTAGILVVLAAGISVAQGFRELVAEVQRIVSHSDMLIAPVMKCIGIGLVTKMAAELCRDSSQSSAAAAIDMVGAFCAIATSLPLFMSMLRLIGAMV